MPDMVAWKMIGYPGARYNYLDWVNRHNERFPLPPVSMTGRAEWGLRSVQDDADSHAWSGDNVFDVYSKSERTALDGTRYSDW